MQIGITGGIGSGKSTVCKIVECLGFPVYYADVRAKYITETDPLVLQGISDNFGPTVFVNGILDRGKLGHLVFSDPKKLGILNRLIHPAVRQDYKAWLLEQKSAFVYSEIAILFELGRYRDFDVTVLITAPEGIRIQRIRDRNGLNDEEIKSRINTQWTDEQKEELAQYVITNDNDTSLIPQVVSLIHKLESRK